MSLSERLKPRPAADPGSGSVLARSRSFAGLLHGGHRRTPSAASSSGGGQPLHGVPADGSLSSSSGASSGSSTLSKSSVLGQHHSPHAPRRILQGISSTWSGKPPRSPRPARTLLIFNAVERGLRECVSLAQEDILSLRSSVDNLSLSSSQSQGKLYDCEKQLKAAERYLKRIEFQLSKVEELREHYEVQQRMRDGVRSMAYAYVLSPGCEKDNALHGVRSGYRECVDTLCVLEAHLEQLMGTLQFQMRGIQGFARLCAGDVFEISVKHGDQKWKSRGRVQKNGQQVWDNQQVIMKALLGEFLFIKAVEVRGLGKNMLLGNKSCEIKELFSSHSQLMTINLNSSGSLKLNLVITWNPLHGCMEDNLSGSKQSPPVLSVMSSPFSRRRGTSPFRGDTILERTGSMVHELETGQRDWRPQVTEWEGPRRRMTPQGSSPGGSLGSAGSMSAPSSTLTSPNEEFPRAAAGQTLLVNSYVHNRPQSPTLRAVETTTSQRWSSMGGDSGSDCCSSLDLAECGGNVSPPSTAQSPLREAVQGLSSCLEDIQGHYPELHSLEQSIAELDRMLRKRSHHRRGSTGSNVSISVESALGCFDFLDSEETESSESSPVRQSPYKSRETKNGGTADSGVALLKDRKSPISGGSTPSPVTVSTGSDQLDCVIAVHCRYCIRLVESLGTFGPLRCRERTSIEKLQHQSRLLYKLLRVANRFAEDRRQLYGSQLVEEDDIGHLWCQMGTNDGLVTTLTRLRDPLARLVRSRLNNGAVSERVVLVVLQKMLDVTRLEPDMLVTVLQFQTYFAQLGSTLFMDHVEQLEAELKVLDSLSSRELPIVKRTLSALKNVVPTKELVFAVSQILVCGDRQLSNLAEQYLKAAAKVTSKAQICALLVEGLEADAALTRQGCCRALSFLQAQEYMEELVHLSYADEVAKVRQQAKEALFSFGEDGRREFQQSQLVAHGFQGLTVK
ncbi:rho family-interacting cell polarization regulator 1 isoform X1 [Rhipicephalus sanguineus]|uniref:rho family-interacting cell polarization regulator 1 isoform X1 n=1 Tax=Rhipicephalus sanguineus TaxID=34632 RepID=UPI001893A684|nr:rho family-interacting cell polarization regulator 1 isoform X1 [Rhipicephalus sanguineus]XP_049274914.1 rho family-interacting cell polarization regulator 1 isoform X1 [Rhipicephalus sanguineus]